MTWRLIFLSTGEVALADMLAQVRQRVKAGQQVRVIDIPADAGQGLGIFDTLPEEYGSGGAYADHLKDITKQQHGTAFIAYLEKLVQDIPTHLQTIRNYREQWREEYLPGSADSQVKRVADHSPPSQRAGSWQPTLVLPAGIRVMPGPVRRCASMPGSTSGGLGNQEEADILAFVRNHFEEHGAAKYVYINLRAQDDKTMYRMGYRDDAGDYFVLPGRFESELCRAGGFEKSR
ncbi:MAG: hypothetical protein R3E89_15575 [Thiolinea sp.]